MTMVPAPSQPGDDASVDLARYAVLVRRSWRDVTVGAVVGLLLAVAFLLLATPGWSATATVDVNAITTDPFDSTRSESDLIDPATEVVLARSSTVVREVVDDPDDDAQRAALRASIEVVAVPDSTLLQITSTTSDPARARAQADAVAQAYLAYRGEQSQTRRSAIVDETEQTIAGLEDSVRAAQQVVDQSPEGSAEATQAQAQISSFRTSIASLSATRDSLASLDVSGGTLLNPASEQAVSRTPAPRTLVLGGLLGGLLVGLAWGVGKRALRRRVRDDLDLERVRGLDVVATLDDNRRGAFPPRGSDLELIRALGARLARLDQGDKPLPGRLTLVLDDTTGHDIGDLPGTLAVVLRQEWGACHVVVAGSSPAQELMARGALGLPASDDGRAPSSKVDRLTVSFHAMDSDITATDSVLSSEVLEHLGDALAGGERVLLHVRSEAGTASLLAASSVADSAVVLLEAGHSRTADLLAWVEELSALPTAAVLVPAGRVGPSGRNVAQTERAVGVRRWVPRSAAAWVRQLARRGTPSASP